MVQILINFLLVIHVLVSILLVLVVLMQRPRSEGLGAAFGGGMTDNIFGAQTSNVLSRFTVTLGSIFLVLTLVLALLYARSSKEKSGVRKELAANAKPVAAETTPATNATALPTSPATKNASTPLLEQPKTAATPAPTATPAAPTAIPAPSATPVPTATP